MELTALAVTPAGQPTGTGHEQLVDSLLARLPPIEPVDLVILAYASPDREGHKTIASYLNMRTGGGAHSFALCGAGPATAFVALGVVASYQATGRCRRALLMVVENAAQDGLDPASSAAEASGVALLLSKPAVESTGPVEPTALGTVRALPDSDRRPEFATGSEQDLLVLDSSTPDGSVPGSYRVPAGHYCTGAWLALAHNLPRWSRRYPAVTMQAHDPVTGRYHASRLEFAPTAGRKLAMTATFALPLVALDRYELVSEHEVIATKLAHDDGGYLAGHYPGSLIYPGVFVIETITQAVRVLVDSVQPTGNPRVRLTAVPVARFFAPVVAGDLLSVQCRCRYPAADLVEVEATCQVEGNAVAQVRCSFRLDPTADHG